MPGVRPAPPAGAAAASEVPGEAGAAEHAVRLHQRTAVEGAGDDRNPRLAVRRRAGEEGEQHALHQPEHAVLDLTAEARRCARRHVLSRSGHYGVAEGHRASCVGHGGEGEAKETDSSLYQSAGFRYSGADPSAVFSEYRPAVFPLLLPEFDGHSSDRIVAEGRTTIMLVFGGRC